LYEKGINMTGILGENMSEIPRKQAIVLLLIKRVLKFVPP